MHYEIHASMMQDKKDDGTWGNLLSVSSMGIMLVMLMAMGLIIGHYLDKWLSCEPVCTLVFFGIGTAGGIRQIVRDLRRINAEENKHDSGK
jgi:F0F1-type ATP synthase assembly protein I